MVDETNIERNKRNLAAYTQLGELLREERWHPQTIQRYAYQARYSGKNGYLICLAQVRIELSQFLVYVLAPVDVPTPLRPAVSEFVTRANYGVRIGNFEMSYQEGTVRYKTSLDFEGTALVIPLMRNALYMAGQMMDRYLPALEAVVYHGQSPVDAIYTVEN